MNKINFDYNLLVQLYIIECKPIKQIAKLLCVSHRVISRNLIQNQIKLRSQSEACLLRLPPSNETKQKMSVAQQGKFVSEETCKKISIGKTGKKRAPFSATWKRNIGNKLRGKKRPDHSIKMSGKNNPFYGVRKYKEQNPNWQGGIGLSPYAYEFTSQLKLKIFRRDLFTCQHPEKNLCKGKLGVHHIDYDKMHCNDVNLITLCRGHNSSVNFNREYWTEYFISIMKGKYL